MARGGGGVEADQRSQLAHAALALRQEREQAQARGAAQGAEEGGLPLHVHMYAHVHAWASAAARRRLPTPPGAQGRGMTPHEHADALLAWLAAQAPDALEAAWARDERQLLAHAAALADAADSNDPAVQRAGLAALFPGFVERLNDGFRPAARWFYHRVFAAVVWRACERRPALARALAGHGIGDRAALTARHARVRARRDPLPAGLARIAVLSRVTIGADVLLTSVLVQRLRARYPEAEVAVLGDAKLAPLFGGWPGVRVQPLSYARRGPLSERLAAWLQLAQAIAEFAPDAVVAPDSRLDQLGILPVCPEERYRLWENLQPEQGPPQSLVALLNRWCDAVLGAGGHALPQLAFDAPHRALAERWRAAVGPAPLCAVKLDHGGNPDKALDPAQEAELLRGLAARGWRLLLDRGFGAEELAHSETLLERLGWRVCEIDDSGQGLGRSPDHLAPGELAAAQVIRFHGSIGGWAAALAACAHAVSYDSVGQHLAAALGVPTTVPFLGWPDPAFPVAWRPQGRAPVEVLAIGAGERRDPGLVARILDAVPRALP